MEKTQTIKNSNEFRTSSRKYLDFKKKLNKYLNPYQVKKIEKSFNLACDAHRG